MELITRLTGVYRPTYNSGGPSLQLKFGKNANKASSILDLTDLQGKNNVKSLQQIPINLRTYPTLPSL